ncbi:MerR family transcriptional regulator [uncultured Flavobacterium sp.]|uniref:MerR family transcriptional regulator n=1 Tax=uncultured Flavobacterium sp. TaxID=165435 RepID=UPI0025F7E195|nr:MerR family transcriptional regulator [uncultured Flavobacterium sp.]
MNSITSVFSIKDLENISGIKAHTIRIWEKRYNILEPMRTDSNIRLYDAENLQKLLNITLLHTHGYKISKISQFPAEKIPQLVKEIISEKSAKIHAISAFKMAMMNFDQALFFNTYESLLSKKSFREIFSNIFIPLLNEIGLLWQTGTITPAHEHFICYLVKQKLSGNIEKKQMLVPQKTDKVFVLYLPENEMNEFALMYLHYEILYHGYQTVYLGKSISLENLKDMTRYFSNIVFVAYCTISPAEDAIDKYVAEMHKNILQSSDSEFWILGKMTAALNKENLPAKTFAFTSFEEVINKL